MDAVQIGNEDHSAFAEVIERILLRIGPIQPFIDILESEFAPREFKSELSARLAACVRGLVRAN